MAQELDEFGYVIGPRTMYRRPPLHGYTIQLETRDITVEMTRREWFALNSWLDDQTEGKDIPPSSYSHLCPGAQLVVEDWLVSRGKKHRYVPRGRVPAAEFRRPLTWDDL